MLSEADSREGVGTAVTDARFNEAPPSTAAGPAPRIGPARGRVRFHSDAGPNRITFRSPLPLATPLAHRSAARGNRAKFALSATSGGHHIARALARAPPAAPLPAFSLPYGWFHSLQLPGRPPPPWKLDGTGMASQPNAPCAENGLVFSQDVPNFLDHWTEHRPGK